MRESEVDGGGAGNTRFVPQRGARSFCTARKHRGTFIITINHTSNALGSSVIVRQTRRSTGVVASLCRWRFVLTTGFHLHGETALKPTGLALIASIDVDVTGGLALASILDLTPSKGESVDQWRCAPTRMNVYRTLRLKNPRQPSQLNTP